MKKITLILSFLILAFTVTAQADLKGLSVDDKAPNFSAIDQNGKKFNLKSQLKKGAVVMVFYRGQWCPYCNKQLKQLEDSLYMIVAKGASVVAITPEKPANVAKTIAKTKATFPVLYDDGLKIMKKYDVAFKVDDNTIERYKKFGVDFTEANGANNGANLPVPAVYIVKDGKVIFRYFDVDYRKRAYVVDILKHL